MTGKNYVQMEWFIVSIYVNFYKKVHPFDRFVLFAVQSTLKFLLQNARLP